MANRTAKGKEVFELLKRLYSLGKLSQKEYSEITNYLDDLEDCLRFNNQNCHGERK